MVLLLGEAEDFRALAGTLRQFARSLGTVQLDSLAFCEPGGTALTLTAGAEASGVARQANGVIWRLDANRAQGFAAQLDALAEPTRIAGSEVLECRTEEEIPVKASRGEYTDDFLCRA